MTEILKHNSIKAEFIVKLLTLKKEGLKISILTKKISNKTNKKEESKNDNDRTQDYFKKQIRSIKSLGFKTSTTLENTELRIHTVAAQGIQDNTLYRPGEHEKYIVSFE